MGLLSRKEVLLLKLKSIPAAKLREISRELGYDDHKNVADIIKQLVDVIDENWLDKVICTEYEKRRKEREKIIPQKVLLEQLRKLKTFNWGVVQGQLDNKIQVRFVRKYFMYDELLQKVKTELYDEVKHYVLCTWYNYWTTVLIEDLISTHPAVVPTIKNVKGIDLFFDGQPFDLKITYLPSEYLDINAAMPNPKDLIVWFYENQGAQRFGADNRLFVVVHNFKNPDLSWQLKREVKFLNSKIREFFSSEKVSEDDEVVFNFGGNTYSAIAKILFVVK
ncbi:hypothetical protein J7K99_02390 [bacterium]|nr:hypothetical protein [bacterium]